MSPIRNVLSSTLTEGGDGADGTAEAPPTLLWDSYDLHDVKHDTSDRCVCLKPSVCLVGYGDRVWSFDWHRGDRVLRTVCVCVCVGCLMCLWVTGSCRSTRSSKLWRKFWSVQLEFCRYR